MAIQHGKVLRDRKQSLGVMDVCRAWLSLKVIYVHSLINLLKIILAHTGHGWVKSWSKYVVVGSF